MNKKGFILIPILVAGAVAALVSSALIFNLKKSVVSTVEKKTGEIVFGLPETDRFKNVNPFTDNTYHLGDASLRWEKANLVNLNFTTATGTTFQVTDGRIATLNSTTTVIDNLKVGTDSAITDITGSGLSISGGALTVSGFAPSGAGGAWESIATNLLTPTNTAAGIIVRASSTIDGTLRVSGSLNATSTVTDSLKVASDSPITDITGTGLSVSGGALTVSLTPFSTTNLSEGSNLYYTQARWDSAFNSTSTWAGFQNEFNSKLNATTTLDLNSIQIASDAAITDITGTGLTISGGALQSTLGTSVDLASEVTGTLPVGNGGTGVTTLSSSELLVGNGTSAITSTSTVAVNRGGTGIQTAASGSLFYGNGTSPFNTLAIGAANRVLTSSGSAPQWSNTLTIQSATTTNLAVTGYANCTAVEIDANGTVLCGTDDTGGASGSPGAWEKIFTSDLTPTNTASGIFVRASSTIQGSLRVDGNATTTNNLTVDTNTLVVQADTDRVGIGTASPSSKLHVITGTAGQDIAIFRNDTDLVDLTVDTGSNGIAIRSGGGDKLILQTNAAATDRVVINSTGEVGIATSTPGGQHGETFTVNGLSFFEDDLRVGGNGTSTAWRVTSLNLAGDDVTDITGTGLQLTSGALQATLGVSVDLASEVTGTLPVGNGGTGATTHTSGSVLLGNGSSAITSTSTLSVVKGGTGVATLTDGGLLYGGGTSPISALGVATNGQIPIGDGSGAPTLTTLTGTANEIDISNGAGSITIGLVDPLIVSKGGTGAATLANSEILVGAGTGVVTSTSTVAVNRGGTGQATLASGSVLYGNGTSPMTALALGSARQVLQVNSGATAPEWTSNILVTQASTTNFAITGYGVCTALETNANGTVVCGTDDTGGSGTPGAWENIFTNAIRPTNTSAGIFVQASSTIDSNLRITGSLNATTTVTDNLKVGSASTITSIAGTGLTITGGALQSTLGTSVDLSSEVTGTLPVGNGGTGATTLASSELLVGNGTGVITSTSTVAVNRGGTGIATLAAGSLVYGNGTSPMSALAIGAANTILTSSGSVPQWSTGLSMNSATVTDTLVLSDVTSCTEALETNASGQIICGTDVAGGSSGSPGAWEIIAPNLLTPTNTAAGIIVRASSTIDSTLRVSGSLNATSTVTDSLKVSADSAITDITGSGLTVSAGALTLVTSGDWTGTFDGLEGTAYAKTGVNGAWENIFTNAIRPTNTSAGIFVQASSTIDSNLRVTGSVNATSTVTDSLKVASDAAITDITGTGLSISAGALQSTLGVSVDLASEVTGTLPVGNGGTGATTHTSGSILLGQGSSAITSTSTLSVVKGGTGVATLTDGGVLFGGGTSPITASAVLTNGQLLIGDGSGVPTLATLTGTADEIDITNGAGSITIGLVNPLIVSKGGTGVATLSNSEILVGAGTGAITSTSTIAVNRGGTGQATLAAGSIFYGNGTSPMTALALGTTRQLLQINTGATAPEWTSNILVTQASTTNFAITGYGACTALETNANGTVLCGTDDTVGGGGAPGAWELLFTNALTPTSSSAGIFVKASSTVDNNLRVAQHLTVATTTPWDQYGVAIATTTVISQDLDVIGQLTASSTSMLNGVGFYPATSEYLKFPEEEVVTNFASGHGFTATCVGCTQSDDLTQFARGSQSLKMITAGNGAVATSSKVSISPTIDMSDDYIKMMVRVDTVSKLNQLWLLLSSNNNFAGNYYRCKPSDDKTQFIEDKWVVVTIPFSYCSQSGSPNRTAINAIALKTKDDATGAVTVNFGGLSTARRAQHGTLTFTFDDGIDNQFSNARPKLDAYGFPATAFIIPDFIGTAGYMAATSTKALHDLHGWDVAGHDAGNYTSISTTEVEERILKVKNYLIKNGFTRGQDVFAWPQGGFNHDIKDIARKYLRGARGTVTYGETLPPADPYHVRAYYLTSATAASTIQTLIDNAVSNNEWLVLIFHGIVASGASGDSVNQSTFDTIVDYAKTSDIGVRTFSEVMNDVGGQNPDGDEQIVLEQGNAKGMRIATSSLAYTYQLANEVSTNNLEIRFEDSNAATAQTMVLYGAAGDTLHLRLLDGNLTVDSGLVDLGGAVLEIPNGTAPTVDSVGEFALDTTAGQLVFFDTAVQVINATSSATAMIENLAAADDNFEFWIPPEPVTVKAHGCHCRGTCTTAATIVLEDRSGNAMTGTATCSTGTSNTTFKEISAGGALVAGEGLRFDVTNAVSPETDEYTIMFRYTKDRQ